MIFNGVYHAIWHLGKEVVFAEMEYQKRTLYPLHYPHLAFYTLHGEAEYLDIEKLCSIDLRTEHKTAYQHDRWYAHFLESRPYQRQIW